MFINGDSIDLDSYNLFVTNVRINVDPMEAYLEMNFTVRNNEYLGDFFEDLNTMNNLRNNKSAAVQKAYEHLKTLAALTETADAE